MITNLFITVFQLIHVRPQPNHFGLFFFKWRKFGRSERKKILLVIFQQRCDEL